MDNLKISKDNLKKIQFYPSIEKLYSLDKTIVEFPPEGYTFIGKGPNMAYKITDRATSSKTLRKLIRPLYHLFLKIFKTTKICERTKKNPIMQEANLVFSGSVIYDIKKPWILYMFDHPTSLAGNNYPLFLKYRDKIEQVLLSPYCKKIIYTNQTPIEFMKKQFCKEVVDKIVLIDSGMKPIGKAKTYPKDYNKKKKRILFMGSINNPLDFYIKGGLEVIKTMQSMSKRKDVEFVVRCMVSDEIKEEISKIPNATLIDKTVPFEEIIKLYESADILFMPGHNYSVTAFLEAMSVGVPIIALNTYAVQDYIENGFNGFIVQRSDKIKGYTNPGYPSYIRTDTFTDEIKSLDDPELIARLKEKLEYLLANPGLIKKTGQNARKEFLRRYSLEKRNKEFKEVFDKALEH